uniref:Zinc metalloproteinase n=1 Tax=Parastrongyloides trichosuri TaxID=131310 RepID=A0A0N5A4D6_PARTI
MIIYFLLFFTIILKSSNSLTRLRLQQKTRESLSKDGRDNFDKHVKSMETLKKLSDQLNGRRHTKINKDKEVKETLFGNAALFQGDMILTPYHAKIMIEEAKIKLDAKKQGKNITDKNIVNKLKKMRAFERKLIYQWKCPIPYYVDTGLDADKITAALKEIEKNTCIRFKKFPKFSNKAGLRYYSGEGCFSDVGRVEKDKVQDISIVAGYEWLGIVGHETLHALGFQHEQSRPDRDKYVKIIPENIDPEMRFNFDFYGIDKTDTLGIPYNYGSAMHYDRKAFSMNGGDTMLPTNELYANTIGSCTTLQFLDYQMVNTAYCSKRCKGNVKCENGGYENPNKCGTCLCPYLLTGDTCTEYIKNPPECGESNFFKLENNKTLSLKPKGILECVYAISSPTKVKLTFVDSFLKIRAYYCFTGDALEVQYLNDKRFTGVTYCGQNRGKTITSEGPLMLIKYTGYINEHFAEFNFQSV